MMPNDQMTLLDLPMSARSGMRAGSPFRKKYFRFRPVAPGESSVAVLFARERSEYFSLPDCDVWPRSRDARNYSGSLPVVAHPPCRGWARLRHLAKPIHGERELAIFAVEQVRRCGGVLEHPAGSTLWAVLGLPLPGEKDLFGGTTLSVYQGHFGHRAPKHTWLYVVGAPVLPVIPTGPLPDGRIELMGQQERERTPLPFAKWLVELAKTCRPGESIWGLLNV